MSYLIKNGHIVGDTGTDYAYVGNKPLINNNELTEGNHTSQDLGITKVMTLAEYNAEPVHSVDCLYIILDGDMQNPDANYNDLANKPSINGVVLTGNKPLNSLDLYDRGEVDKLIAASRSIRTVTEAQWAEILADPEKALPNTVYYVPHRDEGGTLVEGVYEVYLFDANKVLTPMGLTEMDLSDYLKIIPYHNDPSGAVIYEIGHNEGKEDGRELTSHSVINAINEIDTALQDRVKVEEEDLETDSKKVVEAINEVNDKTKMIEISIGDTISGTLSDEDYNKIKARPEECYIKDRYNIYYYSFVYNGQYMYSCIRPDTNFNSVNQRYFSVKSDKTYSVESTLFSGNKFTMPDCNGYDLGTIEKLDDFIAAMPNNSSKEVYASLPDLTNPGWVTIRKYSNMFVKILYWTRREGLAYVRSKDNSTTWSSWYKIAMSKDTAPEITYTASNVVKNVSPHFYYLNSTIGWFTCTFQASRAYNANEALKVIGGFKFDNKYPSVCSLAASSSSNNVCSSIMYNGGDLFFKSSDAITLNTTVYISGVISI